MDFSLIVATKGRSAEIGHLLESVYDSLSGYYTYEVILVDQNPVGYLYPVLNKFSHIPLTHVISKIPGLSLNRNIGLKMAKGDIVCFPDDDCMFYEDTFTNIYRILESSELGFCIGRIYDRDIGRNVIKNWPKYSFKVGGFSSYFINSSITMFLRREIVLDFDENLGVGATYGSCEDADFLYRIIQSGAAGIYTPAIEVWHPDVAMQDISLDKVRKYASGFGYFISKDLDFTKIIIFALLLAKKILQLVVGLLSGRFNSGYFKSFFSGLLSGLFRKVDTQ